MAVPPFSTEEMLTAPLLGWVSDGQVMISVEKLQNNNIILRLHSYSYDAIVTGEVGSDLVFRHTLIVHCSISRAGNAGHTMA